MYGVLILAAGKSTRFGANKLLVSMDGTPLIFHSIRPYLDINEIMQIAVITGAKASDLEALLKDVSVTTVFNPFYKSGGMISSIEQGINYMNSIHPNALFIHPGDIPSVARSTIQSMIDAYQGEPRIIIPKYEKATGHPVLIPWSYRDELYQLQEETQDLRGFLREHRENILYLQTEDRGVLFDVDNPADLDKLRSNKSSEKA